MNLNGPVTETEVPRLLLGLQPFHQFVEDLALAIREPRPALFQGWVSLQRHRSRRSMQCLMDQIDQLLLVDRFFQDGQRARAHRPYGNSDIGVRGEHDYGNVEVPADQLRLQIETAHPWHAHIRDDAGLRHWRLRLEARQEGIRRAESLDVKLDRVEQQSKRIEDSSVVIYEINNRFCSHCNSLVKSGKGDPENGAVLGWYFSTHA